MLAVPLAAPDLTEDPDSLSLLGASTGLLVPNCQSPNHHVLAQRKRSRAFCFFMALWTANKPFPQVATNRCSSWFVIGNCITCLPRFQIKGSESTRVGLD